MPIPCSTCAFHGRRCLLSDRSSRCAECLERNVDCNIGVSPRDWQKLDESRRKLERELEEVEERSSELAARRLRLRKQLHVLSKKERGFFDKELALIELLEKEEAKERGRETTGPTGPPPTSFSPSASAAADSWLAFDWSAVDPMLSDPGPLGAAGGTDQQVPHSASGS